MIQSKPFLADVTLVAATSVAIEATARAVARCLNQVEFGRCLWLSDQPPPPIISDKVIWSRIFPLASRQAYSEFMLHQLAAHVETSHALCVQWDGFVLNGAAWNPAFLQYDYIGALWPQFDDAHAVGNGGFSLRSRKLMAICANFPIESGLAEDIAICRVWRTQLEQRHKIRFASIEDAAQFAFERTTMTPDSFGFHGVFNLINLVPKSEVLHLMQTLEPELLAPNERREVLCWSLRNRQWRTAWSTIRRIGKG